MLTSPEFYEISLLKEMSYEQLVGEPEAPGPLVRLAYPEVSKMRGISQRFRKTIDSNYYWELKTRRDFFARNDYPSRDFRDSSGNVRKAKNWKEEYLSYGQELEPNFFIAAYDGNMLKIEELLDLGINPNAQDDEGWTALMWAYYNDHSDISDRLLAEGANKDIKNKEEWTALAIWNGKKKSIINRLLQPRYY